MEDKNNALITAARKGDIPAVVESLKAGADKNATDKYGHTLLHAAVLSGVTPLVTSIVRNLHPNLEVSGKDGRTAIRIAADQGNQEIVTFLLKEGANPSARGFDGKNTYDILGEKGIDISPKPGLGLAMKLVRS